MHSPYSIIQTIYQWKKYRNILADIFRIPFRCSRCTDSARCGLSNNHNHRSIPTRPIDRYACSKRPQSSYYFRCPLAYSCLFLKLHGAKLRIIFQMRNNACVKCCEKVFYVLDWVVEVFSFPPHRHNHRWCEGNSSWKMPWATPRQFPINLSMLSVYLSQTSCD